MRKYDIYGMGNALVDIEFKVSDAFLEKHDIEKGFMTLVGEKKQTTLVNEFNGGSEGAKACGGSAANTIIGASYFGAKCFYSCKVADDEFGHFYRDDMAAANVDSNLIGTLPKGVTGKCLVMVSPDAERTMNTHLGISETLSEYELDVDALKNSKYFYAEGYSVTSDSARAAVKKAMEIAKEHGVRTSMTFSDPAIVTYFKDGLNELIGNGVDLLFCNKEEAMVWADTSDFETALSALKSIAKTYVVTLGAEGALIFDGNINFTIDTKSVQAVDTTGAGDLFAGAYLYGITNGLNERESGKLACEAASSVVEKVGPRLPKKQCQSLLYEFERHIVRR